VHGRSLLGPRGGACYASRLMRALAMLRRRHIAVLWTGECLSAMGDYFYFVAVMWTSAKLAGSAAGLVAASESGAALAFAAAGGVVADRFDRRWAMIVADLGRALAVAVLAAFALRGKLGVAPLVAMALVLGAFDALFTPALLASVPALVDHPGELQATNALIDATRRLARAIGPSLAGALAAVLSIGHFFTIDALSFCASAAAIFALGPRFAWRPEGRDRERAGAKGVLADVAQALHLALGHARVAWSLAVLFLVNATWAAGFQVGGVLLASRALSVGVAGYGLLVGAYGAGNVVGNVVVGSMHVERKVTTIFAARIVLGAGFLVLASARSLPVAMLGAAIAAIGGPMGELPLVALLQTEFPPHQAGRVFSLRFMIEHAGVASGLLVAAPLFAVAPVRVGIAACAVLLVLGGAAGLVRFGVRG
jgi:DHA3 family macrolide efflux protein-like MFS transporter